MAYQARRNNQSDSGEQQPQMTKKEQNRENTKELAKDAGTVALQGAGVPGPLAGMAANQIAKNPLVNKTLNKVSDKLHKNPIASKAINTVAKSPAKDAAMSAIGGKVGGGSSGSVPGNSAGANASKSNNTSTSGSNSSGGNATSESGRSSLGKPSPFSKGKNDTSSDQEQGKAKTTVDSIGNMIGTIKKIPPWLWPVIGWGILFFLGIIVIVALISQFVPMFGVDDSMGIGGDAGIDYVANSEEEQAFNDRVKTVQEEYENNGATYEPGYISGTFFIMNRYDPEFTFEDMTEDEIRKISELMFKESTIIITCEKEGSDSQTVEGTNGEIPSCPEGYTENTDKRQEHYVYDEESFKSELESYAKDKLSLENDSDAASFAQEVFDYVSAYNSFTSRTETQAVTGSGNGAYWWPVGSKETTTFGGLIFATGDPASTYITSYFGPREDPFTHEMIAAHGALDIAGGQITGPGVIDAIAAKDGIVVYPPQGSVNNYGNGEGGGGYGNYVIIQHSDGNFTLYAHLHANTISVFAGDAVRQGQSIGKIGNSGRSTGTHLHFEVRVGQNSSSGRQDPLDFVDPENPRPTNTASSELVNMLHSWEGTGPTPENGNYYVYDDGTGTLTVGYGVAIQYNLDRFASYGIDGDSLKSGDAVPIEIVDAIEAQEISDKRSSITSLLSKEGITLEDYQIDALVSRMYNVGNINGFPDNYKKYGNTQALYDNYMSIPVTGGGQYMEGLKRRREAEWTLFHTGVYQNNS